MDDNLKKSIRLTAFSFIAVWVVTIVTAIVLFYWFRDDSRMSSYSFQSGESQMKSMQIMQWCSLLPGLAAVIFNFIAVKRLSRNLKSYDISGSVSLKIGAIALLITTLLGFQTPFGGNCSLIMLNVGMNTLGIKLSLVAMFLFTFYPIFTFAGLMKASTSKKSTRNYYSGFRGLNWMALLLMVLTIGLSPFLMTILNVNTKEVEDPTVVNIIALALYVGTIAVMSWFWLKATDGEVVIASEENRPKLVPIDPSLKTSLALTGRGYAAVWGASVLSLIGLIILNKSHSTFTYVINYIFLAIGLAAIVYTMLNANKLANSLAKYSRSWRWLFLGAFSVLAITSILSISSLFGFDPTINIRSVSFEYKEPIDATEFELKKSCYESLMNDDDLENSDLSEEELIKAINEINIEVEKAPDAYGRLLPKKISYKPPRFIQLRYTLCNIAILLYYLFPILTLIGVCMLAIYIPRMRKARLGAVILLISSVVLSPLLMVMEPVVSLFALLAYGLGLFFFLTPWSKCDEMLETIKKPVRRETNLGEESENEQETEGEPLSNQQAAHSVVPEDKIEVRSVISKDFEKEIQPEPIVEQDFNDEPPEDDMESHETSENRGPDRLRRLLIVIIILLVVVIAFLSYLCFFAKNTREETAGGEAALRDSITRTDSIARAHEAIRQDSFKQIKHIQARQDSLARVAKIYRDSTKEPQQSLSDIPTFEEIISALEKGRTKNLFKDRGFNVMTETLYNDMANVNVDLITATLSLGKGITCTYKELGVYSWEFNFTLSGAPEEILNKFYSSALEYTGRLSGSDAKRRGDTVFVTFSGY